MPLKWVTYMVCKLYPNKAAEKVKGEIYNIPCQTSYENLKRLKCLRAPCRRMNIGWSPQALSTTSTPR